jgi:hypothetical protein
MKLSSLSVSLDTKSRVASANFGLDFTFIGEVVGSMAS